MFKSKLQELCQRNSWGLPDYATSKDGPAHNPRFTATVTVNGISFNAIDQSSTIKEAHDKAAMLAFHHLSTAVPVPKPKRNPIHRIPKPSSDACHLYKSLLQSHVQKRNLTLPKYSTECEGPSHASFFKSQVKIDGKTYYSLGFFRTAKEAENSAAKVALESSTLNKAQEDGFGVYKNLLQELALGKGLHGPRYATTVFGPPHMSTFISSVEIGGHSFQGSTAKSKKQAEMDAAKVAYTKLQKCANQVQSFPYNGGIHNLHVYIPVHIPPVRRKEMAQFLKKVSSLVPDLKPIEVNTPLCMLCNDELKLEGIALGGEFHVSLGRTVPIQVDQINSIVAMLQQKFQFQKRYWIDFTEWEVFVNDHHTRCFLSIEVKARGLLEVRKQIEAVNEVYKFHNFPEFYKDPRPHVSLAWASGDTSDLLKRAVAQVKRCFTFTARNNTGGLTHTRVLTSKFSGVDCKIGNKIYSICKFQED
ncbi:hypothetical protein NMG60_11008735 [Bertholletia excelsa]